MEKYSIEVAIGAITGTIISLLSVSAAKSVRVKQQADIFKGGDIEIAKIHTRDFHVKDFLEYDKYMEGLRAAETAMRKAVETTVLNSVVFYKSWVNDIILGYACGSVDAMIFSGFGHWMFDYYGIPKPTIPQNLTIPKSNII